MPTIQRPLKTYGTRTYVGEVAAAPGNEDPILANEVDADLDTVYTAWNNTLAQGILWQVSGATLVPTDATKTVNVPGPTTTGEALRFGNPTIKGRLIAHQTLGVTYFTQNANLNAGQTAWVQDDATKSAWQLILRSDTDCVEMARLAPTTGAYSTLLRIDNTGKALLPGTGADPNFLLWGNRTVKGRLSTVVTYDLAMMTVNAALKTDGTGYIQDDATKASWMLRLNATNDNVTIDHMPPAGVLATLLQLDNAGKLYVGPSTAGAGTIYLAPRCSIGSSASGSVANVDLAVNADSSVPGFDLASNGYILRLGTGGGNDWVQLLRRPPGSMTYAQAANFDGAFNMTIAGATATKATGTTWTNPSDTRLKRDIVPYETGLSAVLQLRPKSFKYNGKGGTVDDDRQCWGLIAQDVLPVMPEMIGARAVKLNEADAEDTTIHTLDSSNVTLALINAIQELAARVAALETA